MRRIPSTTGLMAFEAASRYLSFLQASEELNVTPGAVSRQIQGLEDFLGGRLFLRHHKRVELTPRGRAFLAEIRAPLAAIAAATERIQGETRGSAISICAYPTFAIRWFIPRWGGLYDRYPEIDVQLTTSLNPADFEHDNYDLAIQVMAAGVRRPGLEIVKLIDVDTFPVCSPALAARIQTPGDLAGQTLLHGAPRPLDWQHWLRAAGCTSVDPTTGLRFESLNLAIQAAIEGLGVAIGVAALIEPELADRRLTRPFDVTRRSGRPFHLVCPEVKAADGNLIAVRDWLLAEAAAARPPEVRATPRTGPARPLSAADRSPSP